MIKVENLKKTYDRGTSRAHEVLHGLSFTLPDTGFVCILGASGCGKTSLLNAIGGLDVFDSGKITTETAEIKHALSREMERERNEKFGYIFQNYYLLSEHSVAYNVYIGMHSLDLSKKEKFQRVNEALRRVDMLRYRKRPVGELSGGQQQRVAIARAIARKPRVIFADEPTGNLDEANTMNICSILKELSRESLVVMVTHEERIASFFADRIITLEDGNIVSDSTDWERGTLDAGAKDTIYAADYEENSLSSEKLSVRMLCAPDASPISLTVVAESDRIVIKFNDPRIVISTDSSVSPYLSEGQRPVLTEESFKGDAASEGASGETVNTGKSRKKWFDLGMLWNEVKSLVGGKRLRKFGTGLFIIILSLMLSVSCADVITAASLDREDFITADSHTLDFTFKRGFDLELSVRSIDEYIAAYSRYIYASGQDVDILPKKSTAFKYKDTTIPQLGNLSMSFQTYSCIDIKRFDESTLIHGRMPENYNEIIVDRWVIDLALKEDGIIQNIIPNAEFFLGKTLECDRNYAPVVVGICDSGEPSVYMSKTALLNIGVGGYEAIGISDLLALGGSIGEYELDIDDCIVIPYNAGTYYVEGEVLKTRSNCFFTIRGKLYDIPEAVKARIVVPDEAIDVLYDAMLKVSSASSFTVWTEDKAALYEYLDAPMPEVLVGKLDVAITDEYQVAFDEFTAQRSARLDAKTIVTASVLLICAVMLYLMQRSKTKERMDLITVYRLLGIPKRNLMFVFALESLITTARYALVTVLISWGIINIISMIEFFETVFIFPLWGALLTFLLIAIYRILIAVLPLLTLNLKPPAKLAAEYDF